MLLYIILACVCFVSLLFVSAIAPRRSEVSQFDLEKQGTHPTLHALRERHIADVVALQRSITGVFFAGMVLFACAAFGVLPGVAILFVVALSYGAIAKVGLWRRPIQAVYDQHESALLGWVSRHTWLKVLRGVQPSYTLDVPVRSRDELRSLLKKADALHHESEQSLVLHSLDFHKKRVKQHMTPREQIVSVSKSELLGPLVLDDLHKTGHSWFPVTSGDVDHIVGIVGIETLLTLDVKKSTTAEKAMNPQVEFINQESTLREALSQLVSSRHHMLIVIDDSRHVVGLVSLMDILEVLFGQKIHTS